jgi:hypothetical protein
MPAVLPSRRTWFYLVVLDVVIWVLAEVQNSTGSRRTVFDAIWVCSLLVFVLLLVLGVAIWSKSRGTQAG